MYPFVVAMLLCAPAPPALIDKIEVDTVWAGHPVSFALLTHKDRQFVAYYNAHREMIIAMRMLTECQWRKMKLPETLGWDSHNDVTMALDPAGYLHVSGNMHGKPLVYFRATKPLEITTLVRATMTGDREAHVTYPEFLTGPEGRLIFGYRDGGSGNGDQLYNAYDTSSKKWSHLLDTPLFSGEGKMNAYIHGPVKGPDGRFHLCWVWRDTGACETNHDLSYARSADLLHWETAAGQALALPITLQSPGVVVDPVPVRGGMINGNTLLGFDSKRRPIVSFHKFDANGNTQIYNARFEDGAWRTTQASDWDYRWEFTGGGAIDCEITLSGVSVNDDGTLRQSFTHVKRGSGVWKLDEATLKPLGLMEVPPDYPPELERVESQFPGMGIRRAGDLGASPEPGTWYVLQWETLSANRDRPREGALPAPSKLNVIKLAKP